jgi:hypothetical protein
MPSSSSSLSSSSSASSASGDTISVDVIVEEQGYYAVNETKGFRLRVRALNAVNMPSKIFRYEMESTNPAVGPQPKYNGVCSPADLSEYDEDAPDPEKFPQFFRLDYFDIIYRSQLDVMDEWELVREQVETLVASLAAAETLRQTDSVTISA